MNHSAKRAFCCECVFSCAFLCRHVKAVLLSFRPSKMICALATDLLQILLQMRQDVFLSINMNSPANMSDKFHSQADVITNEYIILTLTLLMSYIYIYIYIYMEHLFLMFLDHTQRRSTVGRTPLDE